LSAPGGRFGSIEIDRIGPPANTQFTLRLLRRAGKLRGEEAELETFERFQTSHNEIGKVGLAKDLDETLRYDGSAGIGDGSNLRFED
jgi:hypothetical protein